MTKNTYDYLLAVEADAEEFIQENCMDSLQAHLKGEITQGELEEQLYEDMYFEDSVTGNGSGSYFCSRDKAEEALIGNLELLGEAVEEYDGQDISQLLQNGPEACDVTIRIYLLHRAIELAVDSLMTNNILEVDASQD